MHFIKQCLELLATYKHCMEEELQEHVEEFLKVFTTPDYLAMSLDHAYGKFIVRHLYEVCNDTQKSHLQSHTKKALHKVPYRRLVPFSSSILSHDELQFPACMPA